MAKTACSDGNMLVDLVEPGLPQRGPMALESFVLGFTPRVATSHHIYQRKDVSR